MIKILKKILVALIISVLVFPHASIALAAKPTPSSSFTLIDSLLKAKKPSLEPEPTTWNGNGTTDGLCNDLSYDESVTAGKQSWLFILTSPANIESFKLNANFSGDENFVDITGTKKGNGAVHFTIDTEIGAKLLSAFALSGTNNSVLTVSHCTHSVKPLDVEKTAETSYTRTWDWDIEKTGKDGESEISDLGEMEGDETETVNYEITLSADSEDHDYLVEGDITIKNPAGNPTATIESILDELVLSGEVEVTCPKFELSEGEEIVCTYTKEYTEEENPLGDTLNTVTVNAVIGGLDLQSVDTADVEWADEPTVEIDECVMVTDTNPLFTEGGEVCTSDLVDGSKTFSYNVIFGEDVELACGLNNYPNTASFVTNESLSEGADTWTVTYTYNCPLAQWCSPGYWRQEQHLDSWIATVYSPDDLFYDKLGYYPSLSKPGENNNAETNPSLIYLLQNNNFYGGDDFNAIGDLLSGAHPAVNFTGDRVENSCPLN